MHKHTHFPVRKIKNWLYATFLISPAVLSGCAVSTGHLSNISLNNQTTKTVYTPHHDVFVAPGGLIGTEGVAEANGGLFLIFKNDCSIKHTFMGLTQSYVDFSRGAKLPIDTTLKIGGKTYYYSPIMMNHIHYNSNNTSYTFDKQSDILIRKDGAILDKYASTGAPPIIFDIGSMATNCETSLSNGYNEQNIDRKNIYYMGKARSGMLKFYVSNVHWDRYTPNYQNSTVVPANTGYYSIANTNVLTIHIISISGDTIDVELLSRK
jgi:hypothetical protein